MVGALDPRSSGLGSSTGRQGHCAMVIGEALLSKRLSFPHHNYKWVPRLLKFIQLYIMFEEVPLNGIGVVPISMLVSCYGSHGQDYLRRCEPL